jgi:hypothetical protein
MTRDTFGQPGFEVRVAKGIWGKRACLELLLPRVAGQNVCQNDGIIMALLVVMRRLCGAFLLQAFII